MSTVYKKADPTSRVRFLGPEWLGKWWDCPSLFEDRERGSCQCEMGKQTNKSTARPVVFIPLPRTDLEVDLKETSEALYSQPRDPETSPFAKEQYTG